MDGTTTSLADSEKSSVSIGVRIADAVADEVDADPIELEPLYETIDPEALEQLFHSDVAVASESRNRVSFTYAGCEVTLYSDDEIGVDEIDADEIDADEVTAEQSDQPDVVIKETKQTLQTN